MKRTLAFLLLALAFPSRGAEPARRRAVLISFDAVGGQQLRRLMAQPGKLPAGGFRRIAERGFVATRSVPPTPSLTAVSHITIATGALPTATGIVSNSMLDRSKPFGTTISGFDAPIRAETLWQAARRQGRRVGVALFPGADGKTPARSADWAMTWPGPPIVRGKQHVLTADAWSPSDAAEKTYSPPRRVTLPFGSSGHTVTVVTLDATDDHRVNYDHLRVESEAGEAADVRPSDWFPVEVKVPDGRVGAWCKLLALEPDLSRVEIYIGPLGRNTGYPREFVREMDEKIGFWPGAGDGDVFGALSDHPEVFFEQLDRLAAFVTRVQLFAIARSDWDLLLCYQPQVDALSHQFWLVDPGQPGFTWERARAFEEFVDRAYGLADRSLDAIERALLRSDGIFVTSDHGMTPVWTEIYPNELLRRAGLAKFDAQKRLDPTSTAVAVVDGGIAHVYLNAGFGRPDLERVEAVFRELRVRGESPFERIVRREEAGSLGLDAPESGELIVLAKPGIHFGRSRPHEASAVGPSAEFGSHGYWNIHPQLQAVFLAAGPGIAAERVETIGSWQIAARIARFLGIDPPRNAAR